MIPRPHYVTLENRPTETDDADGHYSPLSPPHDWVAIQPYSPVADGTRTMQSLVTFRYRSDVTPDTRITWIDRDDRTHFLLVRNVQPVDQNGVELRAVCEEAI